MLSMCNIVFVLRNSLLSLIALIVSRFDQVVTHAIRLVGWLKRVSLLSLHHYNAWWIRFVMCVPSKWDTLSRTGILMGLIWLNTYSMYYLQSETTVGHQSTYNESLRCKLVQHTVFNLSYWHQHQECHFAGPLTTVLTAWLRSSVCWVNWLDHTEQAWTCLPFLPVPNWFHLHSAGSSQSQSAAAIVPAIKLIGFWFLP